MTSTSIPTDSVRPARPAAWQFPPTGGGQEFGWNNAAREFFKQGVLEKMVRETLQNSLDAADGTDRPVQVDFSVVSVKPDDMGADSLVPHLAKAGGSVPAGLRRRRGAGFSDCPAAVCPPPHKLNALSIVDSNTTGLREAQWHALIHKEGAPVKTGADVSGGSFGIGKNAPYNLSRAQTVIYGTLYFQPSGRVERMIGRSQLVSHADPDTGEMLQHVGLLADADGQPLEMPRIPSVFRLTQPGTGLWVLGFEPREHEANGVKWHEVVAGAVVDNFFMAVHRRQLAVRIRADGGVVDIDHNTLPDMIKTCGSPPTGMYHQAVCRGVVRDTLAVHEFGPLAMYVCQVDKAPKRVGYVNRRGMLVTDVKDRRHNPFHPRGIGGWPDFAALLEARTDATDGFVRRMENPAHDQISHDRLAKPGERRHAEQLLRDVNKQVHRILEEALLGSVDRDTANLTEWAHLFPDIAVPGTPGVKSLDVRRRRHRPVIMDPLPFDEVDDGDAQHPRYDSEGEPGPGTGDAGPSRRHADGHAQRVRLESFRAGLETLTALRVSPREMLLRMTLNPSGKARELRFSIWTAGEETLRGERVRLSGMEDAHGAPVTLRDDVLTLACPARKRVSAAFKVRTADDLPPTGFVALRHT